MVQPALAAFVNTCAAVLLCATLLHLASAGLRCVPAASRRAKAPLEAVGLLLMAIALWWPLHLSPAQSLLVRAGQVAPALAPLAPLALAALLWGAHKLWQRKQRSAALGLALLAVPLAWAVLEADLPSIPAVPSLLPALLAPVWVALLMTALVVPGEGRWRVVARAAAGALAGLVLGYGVWRSSAGTLGMSTPPADWLPLLALTALASLGGLLMPVVRAHDDALPDAGRRKSSVDGITGLPLRAHFESRLAKALRECHAAGGALAVMQINIDGFRAINEEHGLQVGDLVLANVGQRLSRVARSQDAIARLSGNDFLMLVAPLEATQDVERVATRVVEALTGVYRIDGRQIKVSASVGLVRWPGKARATRLIACATLAMREARRLGGGRHAVYTEALEGEGSPDAELLHDLRNAISTQSFELHFQPKIDAQSGKITGAEALLRWRHPVRGMIGPDEFVPLAERNGLIGPLGDWVIEEACRQSRAWRDAGLRMRVAINLSAHQMQQEDLVQRIGEALKRHRVHPSLLTCEITETAAMQDTRTTQEAFRQLGSMGVHVSIDDFGTGYSSLAYLRRLPAEELKIDRAFVTDLDHSEDARAVVNAVVQLAHALSLKVVAEGVETSQQRDILMELGCDELQGFLFAKPMPARLLLMWAMSDREAPTAFRGSLFVNTMEAPSLMHVQRPGQRLQRFTPSATDTAPVSKPDIVV